MRSFLYLAIASAAAATVVLGGCGDNSPFASYNPNEMGAAASDNAMPMVVKSNDIAGSFPVAYVDTDGFTWFGTQETKAVGLTVNVTPLMLGLSEWPEGFGPQPEPEPEPDPLQTYEQWKDGDVSLADLSEVMDTEEAFSRLRDELAWANKTIVALDVDDVGSED